MTAALYEGDFAALSSLSAAEMKSVFAGAKVHNIMLEPGMTVLDLALKAKIYKHDRKFLIECSQRLFWKIVFFPRRGNSTHFSRWILHQSKS